jgi:transcriptional regulator with XRE-family HTH domain
MADLRTTLKKKLLEHNISASALEKKAGIRPSSLQNIIQGRSKNPSIEILQLTARALNCTVSELLGEKQETPDIQPFCAAGIWNQDLYLQTIQTVLQVYAQKRLNTSKRVLLHTIEQVYTYCAQYDKKSIDADFVDWTVARLQGSEKAGEI